MNVSFIVNDTIFKTYSYLLSSQSTYFQNYFITHPPPATFIVPPGISKETVQFFCRYIENNNNAINDIERKYIMKKLNESSSKANLNSDLIPLKNIYNNIPIHYYNMPQNYYNVTTSMIPSLLVELYAFLNLYEVNNIKNKIEKNIYSVLSNENVWEIHEKAVDLGIENIIEMCNKYIDKYKINKKRKTNVYFNYNAFNNYECQPLKKILRVSDPKGKNF